MAPIHKAVDRLVSLDTFIDHMSALPQLREQLNGDQLENLLRELYRQAGLKTLYDNDIEGWPMAVRSIRTAIKSMLTIKRLIGQAAKSIDEVRAGYPVQVEYLNDLSLARQEPFFSDTLEDISQSLRKLLEDAALVEAMVASNMHPALRTPPERRLAQSFRLTGRSEEESLTRSFEDKYEYLTPKTPAIDHWFIGAAAECLNKCEQETGSRIRGKDKIIARIFEMMGEPGRTEGSISKELRRQKTQGRPSLPRVRGCPREGDYGPDLLP